MRLKNFRITRFSVLTEDAEDITNALNKHLKGYTLIIDDIDNFFDEELFISFSEAENVQLIVSSRTFLPAVYDTFINNGGIFIDNKAFLQNFYAGMNSKSSTELLVMSTSPCQVLEHFSSAQGCWSCAR